MSLPYNTTTPEDLYRTVSLRMSQPFGTNQPIAKLRLDNPTEAEIIDNGGTLELQAVAVNGDNTVNTNLICGLSVLNLNAHDNQLQMVN